MKGFTITKILACLFIMQYMLLAQTTYTAVANGTWDDPLVWSPQGVPGPGDHVAIGQRNVSINGVRQVVDFSIQIGGQLALTGPGAGLTITGNASWGGGIFIGNGVITIANGAVIVTDDSQWTAGLYGGATLLNLGTVRMAVNSGIWGRDASIIDNRGIFEIDTDYGNFGGIPNGGIFKNTGTIRKVSGSNGCNFNANWSFENLGGTIDVQSGAITFNCDGFFSGGSYHAAAGAWLHFDSGNHVFEGTLSGAPAGRIEISAGVTANTGSSGVTFDFQGTGLAWSGGTFMGSMITIPNNRLLVLDEFSFASVLMGGSTLLNLGTIRQDENLGIRALDLSIVDNQSLYEIVADNASFGGNPNGGIFINTGILRNMGTGTCNFNANWEFRNLGATIEVQSGAVAFNCDGIFTGGSYNVAAGATLHFDSGNHTFEGTLSGTPAGNIELSVGVTADVGASGVTLDFQGTGFNWSGGVFTGGASTLIVNSGLMVLTNSQWYSTLTGGLTLRNQGTIRQEVNPGLSAQDSSIVDNRSLFEVDTEHGSFSGSGLGGVFINSGVFRKVSGTGVSNVGIYWDFQNQAGGVIDGASGEIDFVNLENAPGAIMQGVATIDVPTAFINNGITAPGASAGLLTHLGDYQPSSSGVLETELGGLAAGSDYDVLVVTGSATLDGTLDISLINGYVPSVGDSYVVLTTTGALNDSFATVNVPSGLFVDVQYNANHVMVVVDSVGTVSIDDQLPATEVINTYQLQQNYPNPFNPTTTIRYALPQAGEVTLIVYDLLGRKVRTLVAENQPAGAYQIDWDGRNEYGQPVASGIYLYAIRAGSFVQTHKMMLTR